MASRAQRAPGGLRRLRKFCALLRTECFYLFLLVRSKFVLSSFEVPSHSSVTVEFYSLFCSPRSGKASKTSSLE